MHKIKYTQVTKQLVKLKGYFWDFFYFFKLNENCGKNLGYDNTYTNLLRI